MRNFIYFFGQILFIPHIILFFFSNSREEIAKDLYAKKEFNTNKLFQVYDLSKELLVSKYFRTLFYYRTNGIFAKVLRIFYPKCSSFIIDVNTKIGGGLKLAHPYSTILNAEKIGENVYVNHLVTVGEKNGKKPIIEDGVELNANCMIIGGVTIGKNAKIGAGTVVVKNIPENAIAVGNPAKIIHKN